MKRWLKRLSYGILFAIPMMLLTFVMVEAANAPKQEEAPDSPDCRTCHEEFYDLWETGAHGMATSDPAFEKAWKEKGQPGDCLTCHVSGYDLETQTWESDGIICESCHNPIPANHPLEPMGVDRSAKLCGECHTETYFQWEVSNHQTEGLDCAACHDPHATGLKVTDPGMLCASCHRDRASNFTHTQHNLAGLTCNDCHMSELNSLGIEGHARRDHSFFVSLNTCNECHIYQMHDPIEELTDHSTLKPVDDIEPVETMGVSSNPVPLNPIGFTLFAGMIGVVFGLIVAPWVERFQKRHSHRDKEDQ